MDEWATYPRRTTMKTIVTAVCFATFMLFTSLAFAEDQSPVSLTDEELIEINQRAKDFHAGKIDKSNIDKEKIMKIEELLKKPFGTIVDPLDRRCKTRYKIRCAVKITAAVAACGGPVNVPCIVAALGAAEECIDCL
jgi:hypothetical protein